MVKVRSYTSFRETGDSSSLIGAVENPFTSPRITSKTRIDPKILQSKVKQNTYIAGSTSPSPVPEKASNVFSVKNIINSGSPPARLNEDKGKGEHKLTFTKATNIASLLAPQEALVKQSELKVFKYYQI
jgi:hypothetical protein